MDQITELISSISLNKLIPALLALIGGLIAVKLLCKLFDRALKKTKLDKGLFSLFRAVFKTLLYALVIVIVFGTLGFNVSSLVAILSVVSLALSLAIQGTLSNLAGGIQILSAHPFRIGDYVQIGDVEGTVKAIRLVYTVLLTMDNKEVFVPNSDVAGARIVNFTAEGLRRLDLTFGLSYDCDPEAAKAALLECAEGEKLVAEQESFVGILEYGDSAVQYTLRVWVKPEDYWDVFYSIQFKAKTLLANHGIEITYPHLNVHMSK